MLGSSLVGGWEVDSPWLYGSTTRVTYPRRASSMEYEIWVSLVRWKPELTMTIGALFFSVAVSGRNRSALTRVPSLPGIISPWTLTFPPSLCARLEPTAPMMMSRRQINTCSDDRARWFSDVGRIGAPWTVAFRAQKIFPTRICQLFIAQMQRCIFTFIVMGHMTRRSS